MLISNNGGSTLSITNSPTTSVSGDLACYADTSGAILNDCGILNTNSVFAAATLTNNQLIFGAGSKAVAVGDLTGDVTTAGGKTTTAVAVNGTTVPVNAAADTVLTTTSSAVAAWKAVPNCGSSSTALNYTTATHTWGCQTITTGTAPPWDTITAPSGDMSLTIGAHKTSFIMTDFHTSSQWAMTLGALTTSPNVNGQMHITDTTGNTNTGAMVAIETIGTSTAGVIHFCSQGTTNCISMTGGANPVFAATGGGNALLTANSLSGVASTSLTDTGSIMHNNAANTLAGGTASMDLSGITVANNFKFPVIAAVAPTQNGAIGYDSTAAVSEIRVAINNATNSIPTITGTTNPTTGALTKWGAKMTLAAGDLSGDCTTSGSLVTTCASINGTAFPTSAGVVGSNGSAQPIAATAVGMESPRIATTTGTFNSYILAYSPAITTYTNFCGEFIANFSNTATATININGLGIKSITKQGKAAAALIANDILSGQNVSICYDGTQLEMMSQTGNAVGGTGTIPINLPICVAQGSGTAIGGSGAAATLPGTTLIAGSSSVPQSCSQTYAAASTGAQYVDYSITLPSYYAGVNSIIFKVENDTDTNTGHNNVMSFQYVCVADGSTTSPTYSTAATATGSVPNAINKVVTLTLNTPTITGCSANNIMYIRIGSSATSTYTANMLLTQAKMELH
jgi:hypothetical protein